jgi:hypothetical protein
MCPSSLVVKKRRTGAIGGEGKGVASGGGGEGERRISTEELPPAEKGRGPSVEEEVRESIGSRQRKLPPVEEKMRGCRREDRHRP